MQLLKWILVFNIHRLNSITAINGVFMDEFVEIKIGFNRSLHTKFSKIWFSIDTVDGSLYLWTCKLKYDHLENP